MTIFWYGLTVYLICGVATVSTLMRDHPNPTVRDSAWLWALVLWPLFAIIMLEFTLRLRREGRRILDDVKSGRLTAEEAGREMERRTTGMWPR